MSTTAIREKLHQQIDDLPDDVVEQIADFTLFVVTRKGLVPDYAEWEREEWQQFVLGQLLRDGDVEGEVTYSLDDAVEVYG